METTQPRGKRWPLIAVNAGLAAIIGITALAPAQPENNRARGEYAMVGGEFIGSGGENAVYILDATNQDLIAVRWDRSRGTLQGLGYRDLTVDAQERPGR